MAEIKLDLIFEQNKKILDKLRTMEFNDLAMKASIASLGGKMEEVLVELRVNQQNWEDLHKRVTALEEV